MAQDRFVYVISDLHIGGNYGTTENDRGFRICNKVPLLVKFIEELSKKAESTYVELVINGDFVDFLAEENKQQDNEASSWEPFIYDPEVAVNRLQTIAEREKNNSCDLFGALATFIAKGNKLTILLGNHDIELSFPKVRQKLKELLSAEANQNLTFIYDGEAYSFGEVIIEHGNQYDSWNRVDYDDLRRVRSLQSRNREVKKEDFLPLAGSILVTSVMNYLKKDYQFVDLLKPEQEAVIPMLLALEPDYYHAIVAIPKFLANKVQSAIPKPQDKRIGTDQNVLKNAFSSEQKADIFISLIPIPKDGNNYQLSGNNLIGVGKEKKGWVKLLEKLNKGITQVKRYAGLLDLLVSTSEQEIDDRRLTAIAMALEVLQTDKTFDPEFETKSYLEAATKIAQEGKFKYVIFGHTHLAKEIDINDKSKYLNTGTWADIIKVPSEITSTNDDKRKAGLKAFLNDLRQNQLNSYIEPKSDYVCLQIKDGVVVNAATLSYKADNKV